MMGARHHTAVLVDDHPLLGLSLKSALEPLGVTLELAELGPAPEVLASKIAEGCPDCVLVDLGLPEPTDGLAYIEALVAVDLTVAVLTGESDQLLWGAAAEAGAETVVAKSEPIEEILHVICRLCAGESVRPHQRIALIDSARRANVERRERLAPFSTLSGREQEVLAKLMAGSTQNEIASAGFQSIHTVRTQVKAVMRKLGVRSQIEAVALSHDVGWRPEDPA
ncbi:MAG: response regulator transcription factor [Actinomycetia bacterium]|nr:response regulator transcription factor [Actinomycetes bacterium]MCP4224473.1 response regulator transcription factor [Actinomycetes bacterium]MCP5033775.1 response regulator transcription factor [Actinomycetes bacterium]